MWACDGDAVSAVALALPSLINIFTHGINAAMCIMCRYSTVQYMGFIRNNTSTAPLILAGCILFFKKKYDILKSTKYDMYTSANT
jgi:hypothetical protein